MPEQVIEKPMTGPSENQREDEVIEPLIAKLDKIFSKMAREVRRFNATGPQRAKVVTKWREPPKLAYRAVCRSLTCDPEIETVFKEKYVPWLKHLLGQDFQVYIKKDDPKQFERRGKNNRLYSYTLVELIQSNVHPRGKENQRRREKTKILNDEDVMRLCNLLWKGCHLVPCPELDGDTSENESDDDSVTEEEASGAASTDIDTSHLPPSSLPNPDETMGRNFVADNFDGGEDSLFQGIVPREWWLVDEKFGDRESKPFESQLAMHATTQTSGSEQNSNAGNLVSQLKVDLKASTFAAAESYLTNTRPT